MRVLFCKISNMKYYKGACNKDTPLYGGKFVEENGEPLKCDYVSHHFKLVLKKNNLPEIKFHSLRHSCATALVNSNQVSLPTVQAMLGHSTLDMTRKYVHPDMQEKIKAKK